MGKPLDKTCGTQNTCRRQGAEARGFCFLFPLCLSHLPAPPPGLSVGVWSGRSVWISHYSHDDPSFPALSLCLRNGYDAS